MHEPREIVEIRDGFVAQHGSGHGYTSPPGRLLYAVFAFFQDRLDELDARECFFVEVELRECLASALVVPSVVFEVERGFRGALFVRLGVDAERLFVLFVDDGA